MATLDQSSQYQSSQYQSSQFRQFVDVPLGEIRQNPGQRSIPNEDITALANAMAVDALGYWIGRHWTILPRPIFVRSLGVR